MKRIFCDGCGDEMEYPSGAPDKEHVSPLFGRPRLYTFKGQGGRELPLRVRLEVTCDLSGHIDLCGGCRKYAFEKVTAQEN